MKCWLSEWLERRCRFELGSGLEAWDLIRQRPFPPSGLPRRKHASQATRFVAFFGGQLGVFPPGQARRRTSCAVELIAPQYLKAAGMPLIHLDSLSDPALDTFRNIKQSNETRWTGRFITEGKKLTLQLLQSDFAMHSVLVSETYLDDIVAYLRPSVSTFVLPHALAEQLVGFHFHYGMLGCGIRKPVPSLPEIASPTGPLKLVICPRIENPENLGSILRLSAGFGVAAILLGEGSCDPFSRRVLRVSMGAALRVPTIPSHAQLADHLHWLRDDRGVELIATVLDPSAEPLKQAVVTDRSALLFGNEDSGLAPEWIALCQRRITIPMAAGTDSLNVALAAGIFLHHFFG